MASRKTKTKVNGIQYTLKPVAIDQVKVGKMYMDGDGYPDEDNAWVVVKIEDNLVYYRKVRQDYLDKEEQTDWDFWECVNDDLICVECNKSIKDKQLDYLCEECRSANGYA